MDKTVSWWRVDRLHNLPNFINVYLVRKLSPKDYASAGKLAPDRACRLNARKLRHLDVENTDVGFMLEGELYGLLSVSGFDHRCMAREFFFQNLSQVVPLGDVVFSD